jgi:glycerophosphoryl diester phosphodiesterase
LGHRGARVRAPENTLAAFELARAEGADGVELDVRLDGSGEVVVLHDRSLGRVTGSLVERDVEMLSSRELGHCDVGHGERVPRLAEILDWASRYGQVVNVELKADVGDPRQLVARVTALVRRLSDPASLVLLSSFHAGMVLALARRLERVPVAWLVRRESWLRRSAAFCRSIGAVGIHPARDLVDPAMVRSWQARGLLVNVWTVNQPEEAHELGRAGVDALITDDPATIVGALGAAHWQSA